FGPTGAEVGVEGVEARGARAVVVDPGAQAQLLHPGKARRIAPDAESAVGRGDAPPLLAVDRPGAVVALELAEVGRALGIRRIEELREVDVLCGERAADEQCGEPQAMRSQRGRLAPSGPRPQPGTCGPLLPHRITV